MDLVKYQFSINYIKLLNINLLVFRKEIQLSRRIVVGPDPNVLIKVMGAEDGRVPGQVVKVVHDDGHEKIEHLESSSHF